MCPEVTVLTALLALVRSHLVTSAFAVQGFLAAMSYPCAKALALTLLLSCIALSTANTNTTESILKAKLLKNYDPEARPSATATAAVTVRAGILFYNLENIDERGGTMTWVLWLRLEWNDPFLTWNSTEYDNITQITLPTSSIWTPDIQILNSASRDVSLFEDKQPFLFSDGRVLWSRPAVTTTLCQIELEEYPYDTQRCDIQFESWRYPGSQLILAPTNNASANPAVDLTALAENKQWGFSSISVRESNSVYPCCPGEIFPRLTFDIQVKRRANFYIMSLVIPAVLITFVSFLAFVIPNEPGAERVGLGITTILTLVALNYVQSDTNPISVTQTKMQEFQNGCLSFCVLALVESVASLYISRSSGVVKIWHSIAYFLRLRFYESASEAQEDRPFDPFSMWSSSALAAPGGPRKRNARPAMELMPFTAATSQAGDSGTSGPSETSAANSGAERQSQGDESGSVGLRRASVFSSVAALEPVNVPKHELAKALDRASRLLFPIVYIIFLSVWLSRHRSHLK